MAFFGDIVPDFLGVLKKFFIASEMFPNVQAAADAAHGRVFTIPDGATVSVAVPSQQPTINAALTAISRWTPAGNCTVQIAVAAGAYNLTTRIVCNLNPALGQYVTILGTGTVSKTPSAVFSISGAAGAWSVTFSLNNVTGLSVNDYVEVKTLAGTGNYRSLMGYWKITAVDGVNNRITVLVTAWNAALVATVSGGEVIKYNTTLKFDLSAYTFSTQSGAILIARGAGLKSIENIGIIGDNVTSQAGGIEVAEGARLFAEDGYFGGSLCIADCRASGLIVQTDGFVNQNYLTISDCSDGLLARAASRVSVGGSRFTGNQSDGVDVDGCYCDLKSPDLITKGPTIIAGNFDNGIEAKRGSKVYADYAEIFGQDKNIVIQGGSQVFAPNAILGNSALTRDVENNSGYCLLAGATYSGAAVMPTVGRMGANGAVNAASDLETDAADSLNVTALTFNEQESFAYDRANYTPTLFGGTTAGTPTYTFQSGSYELIGKLCTVNVRLDVSAVGGINGELRISLPFTSNAATSVFSVDLPSPATGITVSANKFLAVRVGNNVNYAVLGEIDTGGSGFTPLTHAALGATPALRPKFSYRIA